MAPRLSYEPSAQSTLLHLLEPGGHIFGEGPSLRRRVSWPVVLRATGLGDLYGGELIIASETQTDRLLHSMGALLETGVAAILIAARDTPKQFTDFQHPVLPVGLSASSRTLQQIQIAGEQFLVRRRRELYGFSQTLQHAVIDAAIGGDDIPTLLAAAVRAGVPRAVFDSEGEVVYEGVPLSHSDLMACRIAAHGLTYGTVIVAAQSRCVAAPVVAGNERRGLVIVPTVERSDLDELELAAETLSQACAIALSRTRAESVPSFAQVLADLPSSRDTLWQVAAIMVAGVSSSRVARAINAELATTRDAVRVGHENETLTVVLPGQNAVNWDSVMSNLSTRLGAPDVRIGVGREGMGVDGANRSARQARQALARRIDAGCTLFQEIEVESLLASISDWEPYLEARLGPLMDDRAGRQDLLRTLEAYLGSGRSVAGAARSLSVHRNTVLYRLAAVQQLLGARLDDERDAFALSLALRLAALHRRIQ